MTYEITLEFHNHYQLIFAYLFEFSEWMVSWENVRIKLCTIYHIPYSQTHPVIDAVFLEEIHEYFDSLVLCNERLLIMGNVNLHVEDQSDFYGKELTVS